MNNAMEGSWEYIAMDKKRNGKDDNNIMAKSLVEFKSFEDESNSNHHCNNFKIVPMKKFPFSMKEGILWQQKNKSFSRYF